MMKVSKRIARAFGHNTASDVRMARIWSNTVIRNLGQLVTGNVANVSAWNDDDKEGAKYKAYFPGAQSYHTTNYEGWRGTEGRTDIVLDLTRPLPDEIKGSFDFILNHTTLEHIFDVKTAFENLCLMSRDAVLIIVPFIQGVHGPEDGDFWRFTPYALRRMFTANGFSVVLEQGGPIRGRVLYLSTLGVRSPEKWSERLKGFSSDAIEVLGEQNGTW